MFCPHCGKEIKDGSKFCRYCGAKLAGATGAGGGQQNSAPAGAQNVQTQNNAENAGRADANRQNSTAAGSTGLSGASPFMEAGDLGEDLSRPSGSGNSVPGEQPSSFGPEAEEQPYQEVPEQEWENDGYDASEETPVKKKSRGKFVLAGALAAAAVTFAVGFAVYSSPEQQYQRKIDLGNKYLEEMDYEQAVIAFNEALEIDPAGTEAEEGLSDSYVGWGNTYIASAQYEDAVDLMDTALDALPGDRNLEKTQMSAYTSWAGAELEDGAYEDAVDVYHQFLSAYPSVDVEDDLAASYAGWGTQLVSEGAYEEALDTLKAAMEELPENAEVTDTLRDSYLAYAEYCAQQGDFDKALEILNEAQELVPSEDITAEISDVNAQIEEVRLLDDVDASVEDLTEAASVDDIDSATEAVRSLLVEHMDALIQICEEHDGTYTDPERKFGMYELEDGQYGLYLGEFSGNDRQGHGIWIVFWDTDIVTFERYDGEWSGDRPNGDQVSTNSDEPNKIVGNVVNGLWDGEVLDTKPHVDTGELYTWRETYESGKLVIIRTGSPTGSFYYIVHPYGAVYEYVCGTEVNTGTELWYTQEDVDATYGVTGFVPQ